VTARHIESDVASFGDSEAEALRELADALESHFGARASDNGSEEDTDE
jgi:predicted RNase H-like HicB family nuclease